MNKDLREVLRDFSKIELEGLEDGDIVTDLVVIARVQRLGDTEDALFLSTSDNTGGVTTHGMLTSAVLLHSSWMVEGKEEDK